VQHTQEFLPGYRTNGRRRNPDGADEIVGQVNRVPVAAIDKHPPAQQDNAV